MVVPRLSRRCWLPAAICLAVCFLCTAAGATEAAAAAGATDPQPLSVSTDSPSFPVDIPGAWRMQQIGTPLDVIFVDPLHGWSRDATRRTTDGGQTWTWAHQAGSNTAAFISPTEGWAAGGYERSEDECVYIDRTTDGGATWARQYTKCGYYGIEGINALHFVDQLHGWAFGVVNLTTTDGGQTWQPHTIQYDEWLKMLDLTHWFKITLGDVYPFCSTTIFTYKLFETRDAGITWGYAGYLPAWTVRPHGWEPRATHHLKGGPYIAPDGKTMVLVGEAGHIARSTDGGDTWIHVPTPFTDDLNWVAFADSAVGWAAGANGLILRTNDGGLSWTRQQLATTADVTYLAAFSPTDALLSAGKLYRTTDGGNHWLPLPYAPEAAVTDFAAISPDALWAAGGELEVTTDGGRAWQALGIAAAAVDAVDGQHAWALGSQLWRTTDGGGHWTAHPAPPGSVDLDFVDPLRGWLIGKANAADRYSQALYRTTDGGSTWQVQGPPPDMDWLGVDFKQVIFADSQHGWVTGQNVLLRTTDGGASWQIIRDGSSTEGEIDSHLSFNGLAGWSISAAWTWRIPEQRCFGISRTMDGGDSWEGVLGPVCTYSDGAPMLRRVGALDANEAWAVGDAGWIKYTTDGGATWQEMYHPSGLALKAVAAVAPGVAYLGGQNGIILRYDAAGPAKANREIMEPPQQPAASPAAPSVGAHGLSHGAPGRPKRGTWPPAGVTTTPAPAPPRRAPASPPP